MHHLGLGLGLQTHPPHYLVSREANLVLFLCKSCASLRNLPAMTQSSFIDGDSLGSGGSPDCLWGRTCLQLGVPVVVPDRFLDETTRAVGE